MRKSVSAYTSAGQLISVCVPFSVSVQPSVMSALVGIPEYDAAVL